MQIDNRVALVSGGASGLGLATVKALLAKGAHVTVLDKSELAEPSVAEQYSSRLLVIQTDITDESALTKALAEIIERFSTIHVCINCAGVGSAGKVLDREKQPLPLENFSNTINTNLIGTFNVIRFVAQVMAENNAEECQYDCGVIINTASVAGFEGQMGQAAYAASKAGIIGLTLPLARDLAQYHVRVMAIAPGLFHTPMMAALPEAAHEALSRMPQNPTRLGHPDEFASLCVHIIENHYLNGEVIRLDAALRLPAR